MSVARGSVADFRAGGAGFEGQVASSSQLINVVSVPLTAAQLLGMYATPVQLIGPPGTNNTIVLHTAYLEINYGGVQTANGGAILVQYDSTANGAGTAATGTVAAATLNGVVADEILGFAPLIGSGGTIVLTNARGKGLYLSNATGAFTAGTSTFVLHVKYEVIYTPV